MKFKLPPFEAWYFALILVLAVIFFGCATKTRDVDLDGMYASEPGTLAAVDPSAGSRRGNLGPDTIVYTKAQADQVFVKKGEEVGMPKFSSVVQTEAANAVTNAPGRTYAVQTNATGAVVVNVPWVEGGGMQPGDLYIGFDESDGEYHLYTR